MVQISVTYISKCSENKIFELTGKGKRKENYFPRFSNRDTREIIKLQILMDGHSER